MGIFTTVLLYAIGAALLVGVIGAAGGCGIAALIEHRARSRAR